MTSSPPEPTRHKQAWAALSSWFVPPVVIPVAIALLVAAVILFQTAV